VSYFQRGCNFIAILQLSRFAWLFIILKEKFSF
jgi:hypothetical protein